ncbi:putative TadZ/CpaE protein [Candidatus Sulfopaludibacter sp. SbA6]|nr:putative TadZ/CpaE protein [Candidatus Sulfopaludibacter sp. SbA6]
MPIPDLLARSNAARSRRVVAGRGSSLVESSIVAVVLLLLLVSITEFGRLGFAYNLVSFATHRGARYAAVRGSASGHPAAASDVQTEVQSYINALDLTKLTVATTWTPNNSPGSTVQVKSSYGFQSILIPMSSSLITVETTCKQTITQ